MVRAPPYCTTTELFFPSPRHRTARVLQELGRQPLAVSKAVDDRRLTLAVARHLRLRLSPAGMAASTSLRAITHRLTTTPVNQLPQIASFLATSLSDCAELLSAPQSQKNAKSESDNAVLVHKLKSRLVSLLQDRSFEGRWTAVVLVKATVEAGQWEILRGCEPFVRGLLSILGVCIPSTPVNGYSMTRFDAIFL